MTFMNKPRLTALVIGLTALCAFTLPVTAQAPAETEAAILARIKPPQFAQRDFPITDFGAKADADCSTALAKAIAACHAAGGGG